MRTLGRIHDTVRARLVAVAVVLCLAAAPAAAKETPRDTPADFSADEMTHDKELGIITARGAVEVTHGRRILRADSISYNQKTDIVNASGSISLLEPTGEVIFAEFMEVTGDLKEGVIRDFRMVLTDGARVAASGGRRTRGEVTEMHKAVYSPCRPCIEDPSRPPLWQVKALKVTHDQPEQVIEYEDAWLEMFGVPLAFTPYLRHPDPTAGRKSGLLPPSFGGSSSLGSIIYLPYYFAIAPNMDATLTPGYTSKEGPILTGQFRALPNRGKVEGKASITQDSKDDLRGHVQAKGEFDIDRTWRWGFDANRSTDETYMRRYQFGGNETLTSNAYIEGFRKRNYMAVNTYTFQDIRADVSSGTMPLVLPMVEFSHVGQPDRWGGRASLDLGMLSLTRTEGADTRRLSGTGGWMIPYTSRDGSVFTLATSVQADLYNVNKLQPDSNLPAYSGTTARVHPELSLEWRHPLVRREAGNSVYQLFEPTVQAVAAPNTGRRQDKIPNEDSLGFEFDETNLFTMNRFAGLDRVEPGHRINYGIKWGVFGDKGGNTIVRVGQSYRLRESSAFNENSGLEGQLSDVIASLAVSPRRYVDLVYRTRIDKEDFAPRRNEVIATVGPKALKLSANYAFFDHIRNTEFSAREQVGAGVTAQITRHWRAASSIQYDVQENNTRQVNLGLTYEDECFMFNAAARRDFYYDRDIRPSNSIMFTLSFKTLGEFHSGGSLGGS
jgi:LPS-assembly protein